ncbi:MAG: hypothetical protein ABIH23_17350, partial [bacterium]
MDSTTSYQRIRESMVFKALLDSFYPESVGDMLRWAHHLWTHHGIYSQAIQRSVRYFMTEFEVIGDDDFSASLRKDYEETLHQKLNILGEAALIGDDLIGFGNTFSSIHFPFWRSLRCPKCQLTRPYKDLAADVSFKGSVFTGTCHNPKCKSRGKVDFILVDTPRTGPAVKPNVMRWPPQLVEMLTMPMSGRKRISVDVSKYDWLKEPIKKGDPLFVEDAPVEVLEALDKGVPLDLDEQRVLHIGAKSTAYRSAELKGWGQPLGLLCLWHYLEVLRLREQVSSYKLQGLHLL